MSDEDKKPRGRPRTNQDDAEAIPHLNGECLSEMDKVKQQLASFEDQIKQLTMDRMSSAPKQETEPQTKMSQKEISDSKDIYLKPNRCFFAKEKFNEKFRGDWDYQKEYVYFIAENNEIKGEDITFWTKPFPGVPCEEWIVPVNKPVWAPRHVAERIKGCTYHQMKMDEAQSTGGTHAMGYDTGKVVVESTVQRLDARSATKKRSLFLGSSGF